MGTSWSVMGGGVAFVGYVGRAELLVCCGSCCCDGLVWLEYSPHSVNDVDARSSSLPWIVDCTVAPFEEVGSWCCLKVSIASVTQAACYAVFSNTYSLPIGRMTFFTRFSMLDADGGIVK